MASTGSLKAEDPSLSAPHILFVDDDEAATRSLLRGLGRGSARFNAYTAHDADQACALAQTINLAAAVVDLSIDPQQGPESGLELIGRLLELAPQLRILVLTGHGAEEYGVRALQAGAASFLVKPVAAEHLSILLQDAISFHALRERYQLLLSESVSTAAVVGLTTANAAMRKVLEEACYAATNRQNVLLAGETGTGKGVIAHAIHRASLAGAPFIRFQPRFGGADLIASELFGHQRGAFTGALEARVGLIEEAHGGTLFLDEVDELPQETQITLLNVLQEGVFRRVGSSKEIRSNFRLIAATNRPLATLRQQGRLREDFYHRIAHLTISIPPLRERREDIPGLAEEFVRRLGEREKLVVQGLTAAALTRLQRYRWPGNVRELQSRVEGGAYRAHYQRRRFIEPGDLELETTALNGSSPLSFRERVQLYEEQLAAEALRSANGNQTKAAETLQLDRTSFRRILQRLKSKQQPSGTV